MLQLTVHFRPRYSVRSCYFLYTAGPGVLYGRLRVSCQLNPLSPSAVAGIFNPRFTEGWMFGLFEVRRWVSYGFLKIKLIRVVTSEYLTVTLYCLRGHTYTARGNGWTPPPPSPLPTIISIHDGRCPDCSNSLCRKQIIFYKVKIHWRAFGFTWLCVGRMVIQGDTRWWCWRVNTAECVVIEVLLSFGCFPYFLRFCCKIVGHPVMKCVLFMFSSKVTTDLPLYSFFQL